jgi:transposase InsO family protein
MRDRRLPNARQVPNRSERRLLCVLSLWARWRRSWFRDVGLQLIIDQPYLPRARGSLESLVSAYITRGGELSQWTQLASII